MRKENSTLKTKFISESGSFLINYDYFAFVELEDCAIYCIADGIDREEEKESARLAVTLAIQKFQEKPNFTKKCAKSCLNAAHKELIRETKEIRLKASLLILMTNYQKYICATAGNARLYHFRENKLSYQSKDHSLSQTRVELKKLPKDTLEEDEERHNLYCYLGQPEKFKPFVSKKRKMSDGETFLLCTKGVWEFAGMAEFLDALEEAKEPGEVCNSIEEFILSRREPVLSSYSIACIFIDKVYQNNKRKKMILKIALAVGLPVLIITITISIVLYVQHKKNQSTIKEIMKYKEKGIEFLDMESYDRSSKEFEAALALVKDAKYKENSQVAKEVDGLTEYDKLVQFLVDATSENEKGNYGKAVEKYNYAMDFIKRIPEISEEAKRAIEQLRETAMVYFDVTELIRTGDMEYSIGSYEKAIATYQEAAQKASVVYFASGKKEALDKRKEVEADLFYQEKKKIEEQGDGYKEAAEKKKEAGNLVGAKEDYEVARELYIKAENQEKAEEIKVAIDAMEAEALKDEKEKYIKEAKQQMKLGDTYYDLKEYENASSAYLLAIETFSKALATESLQLAESKYLLSESKKGSFAKQKQTIEDYLAKAEEKEALHDYQGARVLYELAFVAYQELELSSESASIREKIKALNVLLEEVLEESGDVEAKDLEDVDNDVENAEVKDLGVSDVGNAEVENLGVSDVGNTEVENLGVSDVENAEVENLGVSDVENTEKNQDTESISNLDDARESGDAKSALENTEEHQKQ